METIISHFTHAKEFCVMSPVASNPLSEMVREFSVGIGSHDGIKFKTK